MTPTPNARGRRTVAAIEAAALDAADAMPYPLITVREICERAGVSERVFFNHFPTKEDAFLGRDLPSVDEQWGRTLRDDPTIALMTGAARLVIVPQVPEDVARRRHALAASAPELLARAHATLLPVRERCLEIVDDALGVRFPGWSADQRAAIARVVVAAASELLAAPEPVVRALRSARDHLV